MKCVFLSLFAAFLVAASANPVHNETDVRASCTITSFSQVSSVVSSCTTITVSSLTVPAGKTLDLPLKSGTHLTFTGTTTFSSGTYWDGPLIQITGSKITVDGASGHVLDGLGAKYWDKQGDGGVKKPKFFKIKATGGSNFNNIHLLNCPKQCVSIGNSDSVTLSGWNVDVSAGDKGGLGHNTDGFDVSQSNSITIKNANVKNQDDCVAVNGGTNLQFTGFTCSGGHGLSLSIGTSKTDSSKNKVSNVTFSDSTVKNSRNGIHIKTHVDASAGSASGITYKNIKLSGITNYGINVQQDYKGGSSSGTPGTNIPINGLTLSSVTGTMTSSNAQAVYVLCGSGVCSNFKWSGVSITGAAKKNACKNVSISGFTC